MRFESGLGGVEYTDTIIIIIHYIYNGVYVIQYLYWNLGPSHDYYVRIIE